MRSMIHSRMVRYGSVGRNPSALGSPGGGAARVSSHTTPVVRYATPRVTMKSADHRPMARAAGDHDVVMRDCLRLARGAEPVPPVADAPGSSGAAAARGEEACR